MVGELARYLESRGLDPDPEDIGNQGAFLLLKFTVSANMLINSANAGAACAFAT